MGTRGRETMTGVGRSIRYALREAGRRPLYAATTVATLALAIGANAALLSLTRSILLGGLPYEGADRVVSVRDGGAEIGADGFRLRSEVTGNPWLEAAALYFPDGAANLEAAEGRREARRVRLTQVSADFFETVGVSMLLGPGLAPDESDPRRVVLAHDLWLRAFGGGRGIVGSTVELNGRLHEVVGVAPPDVAFPNGTEVWIPTPADFEYFGSAMGPSVVARLQSPEVLSEAQTFIVERTEEQRAEVGAAGTERPLPSLVPLREVLVGSLRAPLLALLGAGALLLVLGCLNLTGLGVSRLADRSGELAVRRALGASRSRISGQLLGESLALAGLAGVVGLGVAAAVTRGMRLWLPPETPGLAEHALALPVLAWTGVLTLAAGVAVGVLPALHGGRVDASPALGRASEGPGRARLRTVLVAAQMAVALVPAVGAGLLGRSLVRLHEVPLGFDTDSVLSFEVKLPTISYPDEDARMTYIRSVVERLEALPGVEAAGATNRLPLGEGMGAGFRVRPAEATEGEGVTVTYVQASPGFFGALGTRVLRGSPEPAHDGDSGVVVSETLARELFGGVDVVGREIRIRLREWSEPGSVTAVVEDVRLDGTDGEARAILYGRLTGDGWSATLGFAVRSAGAPAPLADAVRGVLAEVDPSVPPYAVRTTRQAVSRQLASRRAVARVGGLLAVLALFLAAMGLYGVVAQGVARRRRELGIRMALGAAPRSLLRRVLARGALLAATGLAAGIPLAIFLVRGLSGMLYEIDAGDPTTLLAAAAVLFVVALVATWLPARSVIRIDPRESLAAE